MDDYSDIINLSRPVSKRPRMTLEQRSAQFAPFAALTGYEGQVKETARLTNKKIEITEKSKREVAVAAFKIPGRTPKKNNSEMSERIRQPANVLAWNPLVRVRSEKKLI